MFNGWFIKCNPFQFKYSNFAYLHTLIDHIDFHTWKQTFVKRFPNIINVMKTVLFLINKWHSNNNFKNKILFISLSIGLKLGWELGICGY